MAHIVGTNGSDEIKGTEYADLIEGRGGNDLIYGYEGDDDIYGGSGNDTIYGGAGDDYIYGGTGTNKLFGGSGSDFFIVEARDTRAYSDSTIRDFSFDEGDRIDLRAWGVSDFDQVRFLLSGSKNAVINGVYGGQDNVVEISGKPAKSFESGDFVYTSQKALEITGTKYTDVLFGTRTDDDIYGGSGNDTLLGGRGQDVLEGDAGNDRLVGGRGADALTGGSGNDSFVFQSINDSTTKVRDVITDFTPDRDVIDLTLTDADATRSGSQSWEWIGTARFDGAGELRYSYDSSTKQTIISGNTDNDSSVEFQIALSGKIKLIADDFYL